MAQQATCTVRVLAYALHVLVHALHDALDLQLTTAHSTAHDRTRVRLYKYTKEMSAVPLYGAPLPLKCN